MGAISSKGTPKVSCKTNAIRSAGESVSERFEYHEQRQAYPVGQQRLVLGVDPVLAVHDGVSEGEFSQVRLQHRT